MKRLVDRYKEQSELGETALVKFHVFLYHQVYLLILHSTFVIPPMNDTECH